LPTSQFLTPTPTPDPTANWKTHTDSKNGFSFKYPLGWTYKLGETYSTTGHVTFDTNLASGNKNTDYIFEISMETQSDLDQWTKYESTTVLPNQTMGTMTFEKYIVADMYYSLK
jgi:hypothetical protein